MEMNSKNGKKRFVNLNSRLPILGRNLQSISICFPSYFIKLEIFEKIKPYFYI